MADSKPLIVSWQTDYNSKADTFLSFYPLIRIDKILSVM